MRARNWTEAEKKDSKTGRRSGTGGSSFWNQPNFPPFPANPSTINSASINRLARHCKPVASGYIITMSAMKKKLARAFLAFLAAAALPAGGCATSGAENAATVRNGPVLGGPNGSISPANPFGLGLGR
jgi:hypothetical protein